MIWASETKALLSSSKDTIEKINPLNHRWKNICNMYSDKRTISRIHKELLYIDQNKRTDKPVF